MSKEIDKKTNGEYDNSDDFDFFDWIIDWIINFVIKKVFGRYIVRYLIRPLAKKIPVLGMKIPVWAFVLVIVLGYDIGFRENSKLKRVYHSIFILFAGRYTQDSDNAVIVVPPLLITEEERERIIAAERERLVTEERERIVAAERERFATEERERIAEAERKRLEAIVPLNILIGVWEGSYVANQGETGLTLNVYKEKDNYKVLFEFYNLPGRKNSREGKYYMSMSYNQSTKKYHLKGYEWVVRPSGYTFINLEGTITENVFSGSAGGRRSFRVVRK